MLCGDRLRYHKPHPLILHKIMQKFSFKPRQSLYVGDMTVDAQAGRRAHIKTVIVTTGSNTKQEIQKEKPDIIIEKIADLLKVI